MILYLNDKINYQKIQETIFLTENIFSLRAYSKENQQQIKEAISYLEKEIINKLDKIKNYLYKKYKKFYDELGIEPIYIYTKKDKEILKLMNFVIETAYEENIKESEIEKIIKERAPFEFSGHVKLQKMDDKKDKIEGTIVFIIVPENTFWNRLYKIRNYSILTTALLNHPLWSKLEFLIFLIHEVIEAEEEILEKRKNHFSGRIFLKYKNKSYSISQHHSIIVLAKEAVILNKYKHLDAVKTLRNLRKYEWKAIKNLTGIDLSTITELDEKTIKKLLNLKKEKILNNKTQKEEEGVSVDYDKMSKTKLDNFINNFIKKINSYTNESLSIFFKKIKNFVKS